MAKKKYYAVARGRIPGIYEEWQGADGAKAQVAGFPKALYKGFSSFEEAEQWLESPTHPPRKAAESDQKTESPSPNADTEKEKGLVIYTDGGCLNNPGPGGYGAVLMYGKHRKELSGGFRLTTNNRMELMACIEALKALKRECRLSLHSDSSYVVNGIEKGWAERWRRNNWMRNKSDRAENADLWAQLLDLCDRHEVKFVWVKGHAGNPENERCDQIAGQAARRTDLPADEFYEKDQVKK